MKSYLSMYTRIADRGLWFYSLVNWIGLFGDGGRRRFFSCGDSVSNAGIFCHVSQPKSTLVFVSTFVPLVIEFSEHSATVWLGALVYFANWSRPADAMHRSSSVLGAAAQSARIRRATTTGWTAISRCIRAMASAKQICRLKSSWANVFCVAGFGSLMQSMETRLTSWCSQHLRLDRRRALIVTSFPASRR